MSFSNEELIQLLDCAKEAAYAGGRILKHHWGRLSDIREKSYSGDLVTEADKNSEKAIIDHLSTLYPNFTILAEESGKRESGRKDVCWIIDPLDGTTNYTHKVPLSAVAIALVVEGEPVVGVIYNPFHNEMYTAAQSHGAYLNDMPIHVSNVATLEQSLLATGFAYDRHHTRNNNYTEFCKFTDITQGVRRLGSACLDLAYVAAGRFDGYWERSLQPWDISAGAILVKEAGGFVTSYDGSSLDIHSGKVLAANPYLHPLISQELKLLSFH